jgi:ubiquinol-cytochrome c reductase cytochrome b subunit
MRLLNSKIIHIGNDHVVDYPTPNNINYWWGFGSLAGICLIIQILTGIFLAMHYTAHIDHAFFSIEHIMRDVKYGWLIRYLHANGASMFFIVLYTHMGRGLYFKSYAAPRTVLWYSGIAIFFLTMGTAFIGYVLPWGQMSFWGATVITNLASAIPFVGQSIAYWLWGGFSVDNATLNRFFSLHYLLPFLIAGLSILHLVLLHLNGSSNPLFSSKTFDKIRFYPYFYVKDLLGFLLFMLIYSWFVFFYPDSLGHSDNYIMANALSTPAHIVPEWYFLPFYAILRSIPDKFGGVVLMVSAILILAAMPHLDFSWAKSPRIRFGYKIIYWGFAMNLILLGYLGSQGVEEPFITLSQCATLIYFMYFFLLVPLNAYIENAVLFSATSKNTI